MGVNDVYACPYLQWESTLQSEYTLDSSKSLDYLFLSYTFSLNWTLGSLVNITVNVWSEGTSINDISVRY
jgi:hypothetical protein